MIIGSSWVTSILIRHSGAGCQGNFNRKLNASCPFGCDSRSDFLFNSTSKGPYRFSRSFAFSAPSRKACSRILFFGAFIAEKSKSSEIGNHQKILS